MILNSRTHLADSETIGMQESISMTIDTSDQVALMSILSENLYKDPIGSLVRESVSNALDTHKEAGTKEPIIVSLTSDSNYNYIFTVQDFGTGISPEVVNNVLSKYASSTKRNSNEYLGYYGLGFKAPLAYTDSFIFTTRVEGIEYTYMMYKSEAGTKIDLVNEFPTKEATGTTIRIQLQNRNDYTEFINKIREQLAYFEGVYFNVPGIQNDFKIIRNEDWKYSELLGGTVSSGKGMHICLDNVYYEIDWQRLGIPRIELNVGLNFKIEDGLLPIPSREDIKYTEEAKELIKIKIAAVADYFVRKFNEKRVEAASFEEIYNKFHITSVDIEGIYFDINSLTKYSYMKPEKPSLKGIKLLDLQALAGHSNDMFDNYEIRGKIYNGKFTGKWVEERPHLVGRQPSVTIILAKDAPKGLQLHYLKDIYPSCRILYKKREMKLGTEDSFYSWRDTPYTYKSLLDLRKYPKSQWREVITEFQSIRDEILSKLPRLETLQPTKQWLDDRKAKRAIGKRVSVANTEITMKIGRRAGRGDLNIVYDPKILRIREVGKTFKSLVIYGNNDDRVRMEVLYPLIKQGNQSYKKPRVTLALISKYDEKKIKQLSNFISIDEFMKGKNKPFQAFATAMLIEKLQRSNTQIFASTKFISLLSSNFSGKLEKLEKYRDENYPSGYYNDKDGFLEEVLRTAQEGNLFDDEIMQIYNEVSDKIANFDFINFLSNHAIENASPEAVALSREILTNRKFRLDWANPLSTPPIQEEDPGDDEDDDDDEEGEDDEAHIGSFLDMEREEDEKDDDLLEASTLEKEIETF